MSTNRTRLLRGIVTGTAVLLVVVAIATAGMFGAAVGKPPAEEALSSDIDASPTVLSPSPQPQVNETDQTTMWANETVVAEGLQNSDEIAISDAGSDGRMHVAFSRGTELYYVTVSTHGTATEPERITTAAGEVTDVEAVSEPDGRAHVLYAAEQGASGTAVQHLAVSDGGAVDFRQTLREEIDQLSLNDAVRGPNGRLYTTVNNGTRSDLWILDADEPGVDARVLPSVGEATLDVSQETLYAAYLVETSDQYPYRQTVTLRTYDVSGGGVDSVETTRLGRDWDYDNFQLHDVSIHPDGVVLVSEAYGSAPADDGDTYVKTYDLSTGTSDDRLLHIEDEQAPHELFMDASRRTFVAGPTGHYRYDGRLGNQQTVPEIGGKVARNGHGYPSVLSLSPEGTVTYRPMVVRSLENYESIAPYGTVNATLATEVERLQSELREARNETGSTIDVTVEPAGDAQSFVAGGEARVAVSADAVDPSAVELEFAGETYAINAAGVGTVPLSESGSQDLIVRHGDASERVTLDVQNAAASDGDNTPGASGPGFGIGIAAVSVLSAAVLVRRSSR